MTRDYLNDLRNHLYTMDKEQVDKLDAAKDFYFEASLIDSDTFANIEADINKQRKAIEEMISAVSHASVIVISKDNRIPALPFAKTFQPAPLTDAEKELIEKAESLYRSAYNI